MELDSAQDDSRWSDYNEKAIREKLAYEISIHTGLSEVLKTHLNPRGNYRLNIGADYPSSHINEVNRISARMDVHLLIQIQLDRYILIFYQERHFISDPSLDFTTDDVGHSLTAVSLLRAEIITLQERAREYRDEYVLEKCEYALEIDGKCKDRLEHLATLIKNSK